MNEWETFGRRFYFHFHFPFLEYQDDFLFTKLNSLYLEIFINQQKLKHHQHGTIDFTFINVNERRRRYEVGKIYISRSRLKIVWMRNLKEFFFFLYFFLFSHFSFSVTFSLWQGLFHSDIYISTHIYIHTWRHNKPQKEENR